MRFARAFGGEGSAPGRFTFPAGVTVVRGLLVVSEYRGKRLQVLTPTGVPLQVVPLPSTSGVVCADHERVWVCHASTNQVHVLRCSH